MSDDDLFDEELDGYLADVEEEETDEPEEDWSDDAADDVEDNDDVFAFALDADDAEDLSDPLANISTEDGLDIYFKQMSQRSRWPRRLRPAAMPQSN